VGYTIKGKLHLVMEKLESRGDLHKEVTDSRWWDAIRSNGEDTGARLRANYTMTDDEGDLFAYSMPRRLKLHLAQEFAHGMLQMRRCNIVHCDIKPCNVMLVTVPHAKEGKAAVPGLKIIDFGEGNTPEEATGFVAGTPGYQAPEVVEDGLCTFASDIYSAGVSLIELWAGDMWAGADTRGEGYLGQRCEVLDALAKIHKADPKVAALLRRCIAENPAHRPSALQLLKGFKTMSAQAQGPARLISRRGRAWAANK
jgi:serine/threonine protein kinase